MHRNHLIRAIAALTAILVLAACASMPLPHDVDLQQKIPDTTREGSVTEPVEQGEVEVVDMRLPAEEGQCVSFADVAPGVTVHSAKLQWIVDANYDGPDLTGKLQARGYVAGADDELFHSSNTLGPVVTIKLDRTSTRLAGAAVLNPNQLQAVNDRVVCFGLEVTGEDLAALQSGEMRVDYSIKKLMLQITFSVI